MEVTPQKPRRILYTITKSNWGGAQRYVYDLAISAQAAGYEVLVASGMEGELTRRLAAAGIGLAPIPALKRDISLSHELAAFAELRRIIRGFAPDVVHGNSSKAGLMTSLAARLERVPHIVFTAHGWAFNEKRPSWQKLAFVLLHFLTVLLSHTTICVSMGAKRDTRFWPWVQRKITVIHNGIAVPSFETRDASRERLAPDLAASFWIGTIAELHPTKQLDVLIRAFAALASRFPDAGLVIMGEGQERQKLERLVRELRLTDRIRLAGHVENAPAYLPALDAFCLPSRSEGLAYVLLEAGAARLPVVASRVGGIPEVIEDGVTGILVPSGNVDAFTSALAHLLGSAETRAALGAALHERVATRFSKEQMVERTFALYR